jgi:streptogramin lyase
MSNSPIQSNNITDIKMDSEGTLWFATWGAGFYSKKGTTYTAYNIANSSLGTDFINCIYIDENDKIWIGSNGKGLYKWNGKQLENYNLSENNIVLSITKINESMYCGMFIDGLVELDKDKKINSLWRNDDDKKGHVHKVVTDKKGNLVISTGIGILIQNKTDFKPLNIPFADTLKGIAYDLINDSKGNIWAGIFPSGNLAKYDGKSWQVFEENFTVPGSTLAINAEARNGSNKYFIYGMAVDRFDNIYLTSSSHGAIARFNNNTWKSVYITEKRTPISSILVMKDSLYAGSWYSGMINMHVVPDSIGAAKAPPSKEKRPVVYKENTITLTSNKAELLIYDAKKSDGDIVSISLNDEWVLENFTITNEPTKIFLDLKPGENILMTYSISEGSMPPNTCSFILKYDDKEKTFSINSSKKTNGAIRLKVL